MGRGLPPGRRVVPPSLHLTWPQYLTWVIRQHGRRLRGGYGRLPVWTVHAPGWPPSSYEEEIRRAHRTLCAARRAGTFAGPAVTLADRLQYAGLGPRRASWFGWMGPAGTWRHAVTTNPLALNPLLGPGPWVPPPWGFAALAGPGRRLAVPTRLLAMTHPDRYFPCTSTNWARMVAPWACAAAFTTMPPTKPSVTAYHRVWPLVQTYPWMTASCARLPWATWRKWHCARLRLPRNQRPPLRLVRTIWRARAAFLDVLFYDP